MSDPARRNRSSRSSSVDSNLTHFNNGTTSSNAPTLGFRSNDTLAIVKGVQEYINAKLSHACAAKHLERVAAARAGGKILTYVNATTITKVKLRPLAPEDPLTASRVTFWHRPENKAHLQAQLDAVVDKVLDTEDTSTYGSVTVIIVPINYPGTNYTPRFITFEVECEVVVEPVRPRPDAAGWPEMP
ncbi:uncharacterized protein LOC62_03G005146 [Vanrija pseudolonga]|uniref:Uncharacterized protein n=1 Tax=Vanrija pseudolonga TaxID=143232 RepID=A0AAF0YDQ2_9TREE|nr:hypothetical protein LOC62_03G005146 [Vanrija pseudolonga]